MVQDTPTLGGTGLQGLWLARVLKRSLKGLTHAGQNGRPQGMASCSAMSNLEVVVWLTKAADNKSTHRHIFSKSTSGIAVRVPSGHARRTIARRAPPASVAHLSDKTPFSSRPAVREETRPGVVTEVWWGCGGKRRV